MMQALRLARHHPTMTPVEQVQRLVYVLQINRAISGQHHRAARMIEQIDI